jgi:excisionase family DNA binding protein
MGGATRHPFPFISTDKPEGMVMNEDEILTLQDVAAYLKMAEKTLYGYAQRGIVPGIKIGSAWRFRKTDIDAWLEERRRLTDSSYKNKKEKAKQAGPLEVKAVS